MQAHAGSWVNNTVAGLALGRYWFYQDFAGPLVSTNQNIIQNDNGTGGPVFDATKIVTNSVVITDTNGNPVNSALPPIPSNEISGTNAAGVVTLNGLPDASFDPIRIWYLYVVSSGNLPTNLVVAPSFVANAALQWLDTYFLNQNLNLSDLTSLTSARTNLGFTNQTAGAVLLGNGGTLPTSDPTLFFWDTTNHRLGIGTNSPSNDLHIKTTAASAIELIETQFTGSPPILRLQGARTANANLALNDISGEIDFYGRFNTSSGSLGVIQLAYTGNGTTQSGDLVFSTAQAGAPSEVFRLNSSGNGIFAGSVFASTIYGSSSASGTLTLRSTSNATKGNVIIGDQTGEKILTGPVGSTNSYIGKYHVLLPSTNAQTNEFVIQSNEANWANGAAGAYGFAFIPHDAGGFTRVNVSGLSNQSYLYHYNASDGTNTGYFSMGLPWGFMNNNTGIVTFKVSGTTGQTADLVQFSNQSDFMNTVASISANGLFRPAAGTQALPAFSFFADTSTGFYRIGAGNIGVSCSNTAVENFATTLITQNVALLNKVSIALEDPGAGTNTVTLQAPTLAGNYTLTLPTAQGAAGTSFIDDGTGILSFGRAIGQKAGKVTLSLGALSKAITFATARADALYTPKVTLVNTVDSTPSIHPILVFAISMTGFSFEWPEALDTANYVAYWSVEDHYDP